MTLQYLSDPLPDRTMSEEARGRFAWGLAAKSCIFVLMWVLLAMFAHGALHWEMGNAVGVSFVATLCTYGAWAGAGVFLERSVFAPHMAIEQRWYEVLRSCGLASEGDRTRVRYLQGAAVLNAVAVRPPAGADPDAFARKLSSMALAWGVPSVECYQRLGGWLSLHMQATPPPPPAPEPVKQGYSIEPYKLPVPRSWMEYFVALPVGDLHRHSAATCPQWISQEGVGMVLAADHPELVPPETRFPRQWGLPLLGSHVLVAGQTGAGKSSWQQVIVRALSPAVAHGAAVLVGIDPKGVELAIGRGIFKYYASEPDGITDLLERMVGLMDERKRRVAGKTRLVRPTSAEPLYVIMIDELAPLTKLDPDAKRRMRTIAAMNTLLTQGRALGFSVVGAVQDPRKETVDNRDLFNIRVALRMPASAVDVVLGPKCREEGATAHQLTAEWAGAGYLYDGEGWALVRACWYDDAAIMAECSKFVDGTFTGADWAQWGCPVDEPRNPASIPRQVVAPAATAQALPPPPASVPPVALLPVALPPVVGVPLVTSTNGHQP